MLTSAASASDAVYVRVKILRAHWHIELDDVCHGGDIESSCCDISSDEDEIVPVLEVLQGVLSLQLGAVAVDLFALDARVVEERVHPRGRLLLLYEDQGAPLNLFDGVDQQLYLEVLIG